VTTATLGTSEPTAELLPGYHVDPETGAWLTLPWPGDPSLPWDDPGRLELLPPSLGFDAIRWCAGITTAGMPGVERSRLLHHLTGRQWQFTPSQKRFLILWYAVDSDGRWLYRSFVKRGAKGTGKDPLCSAMGLVEARGPVVLDDWKGDRPVGRPQRMGLVQIGANSEAQAKDVLRVMNGMIGPGMYLEGHVDTGITRTMFSTALIELLTNSEKSSEGDPATAILLNESHHMTLSSGGQALAAVARRNVAKSPGGYARAGEFTNAHLPGEESVAEQSFEAWQQQVAGQTRRADILYDSREAPPHLRLHVETELEEGIAAAYADSPWTDQQRMRDEAQDPRTSVADSVRFYFNALPTNETAWIDPRKFDKLAHPEFVVVDGEPIAMFLDCSKSQDATALSACRISDGHVLTIDCWQRPHGDRGRGWLAPKEDVDAEVRAAFEQFDVQWFGVDPSPARDEETEAQYWAPLVDEWHRDFRDKVLVWATPGQVFGSSVMFDMRLSAHGGRERNKLFTEAAEQTAADIDEDGTLTWDGDTRLRVHAHNARRRPNQWGVSLGKQSRDSKKLVDLAVTMVGARMGRRLVLNSGKKRKNRTGKAAFF
jgi:hypothetical protein